MEIDPGHGIRPFIVGLAFSGVLAVAPVTAVAARCAGFADVQDTDFFCTAVQWIRNRNVTFGCNATDYCPNSAVTRASMALFLNRMGTALTPPAA